MLYKTALVTGASTGIGAMFAQVLAAEGSNLVLVARSADKLHQLATDLEQQFGIQVWVILQDLTQPDAALRVYEAITQQEITVDLLVNNAGSGDYGEFGQRSHHRQSEMIKLNILSLVEMTHLILPQMQQRQSGGIINIASITGFQPVPYLAVYAATKAFIIHFSEALWAENHQTGVKVLVVCPGPTRTDFFAVADMERNPGLMAAQTYEDSHRLVRQAIKALSAGKSTLVTGGWKNQAIANGSRFTPRQWLAKLLEPTFRPPNS
jgi:uncharacterized protein